MTSVLFPDHHLDNNRFYLPPLAKELQWYYKFKSIKNLQQYLRYIKLHRL